MYFKKIDNIRISNLCETFIDKFAFVKEININFRSNVLNQATQKLYNLFTIHGRRI